MLSTIFYKLVVWWEDWTRKPLYLSTWQEYQGYRKARGGRWGLWEFRWHNLKMWIPSCCDYYPPPPTVTSTEPLETEDYTEVLL